jgi:hypothetical protein
MSSGIEFTLDKMLELAEGQTRHMLIGTKEQLMPVFFILTGEDEIMIVGTPWRGDTEKALISAQLREMMKECEAKAYLFITEAWISPQPKGWKLGDPDDGLAPSERPDREEIVQAMAVNGFETKFRNWKIIRAPDGSCADLKLDDKGISVYVSRFDGLLPGTSKH